MTEIASIRSAYYQLPAVERVVAFRKANGGSIQAVNYTISKWDGGKDTFNYCHLQSRAPVYEGTCVEKVNYTLTSVAALPYACKAFLNGTVLTGEACTLQVDRQLDCAAVCECVTGDHDVDLVERGCAADRRVLASWIVFMPYHLNTSLEVILMMHVMLHPISLV
jgi:hypothetical protein